MTGAVAATGPLEPFARSRAVPVSEPVRNGPDAYGRFPCLPFYLDGARPVCALLRVSVFSGGPLKQMHGQHRNRSL